MTIVYVIILVWSVVQFLLLVLKLANVIKWSWEAVYAPLWLAVTAVCFGGVLVLGLYLVAMLSFRLLVLLI